MADSSSTNRDPARARDHLANERTWLAWLRTATTVMVLGLAITTFVGNLTLFSAVAGGLLVVAGAAGLIYGTYRYRCVNHEIENDRFSTGAGGRGPTLASMVLITVVLVALTLLTVAGLK